MHFGPAHTTGDTAVVFRGQNAVHLGDVFKQFRLSIHRCGTMAGTISGVIDFCSSVRDELDEESTVIPGHGPVHRTIRRWWTTSIC